MGDRNPCRGGDCGDRRDAGHDLGRDACRSQRQRLLAAASEDERVAALQPHDLEADSAEVDEQLVQLLLIHPVAAR